MIEYERTNWYGLGYLLRLRGSLLPHCLPAMVLAGTVAGLFASPVLEQTFALQTAQLFVDKYSMQLFGVVFGYLAVARLNVCYNRYWEGATHVKAMHSKFADAASQIILFDSVDDSSHDVSHKAFCVHIVRLFLQLSAVATITLHLDQDEIGTLWRKLQAELQAAETAAGAEDAVSFKRRRSLERDDFIVARRNARRFTQRPLHDDPLRRALSRWDAFLERMRPSARRAAASSSVFDRHDASKQRSGPTTRERQRQASQQQPNAQLTPVEYTAQALELDRLFTSAEVMLVRSDGCDAVLSMCHRINRSVTTRGRARGWPTPPPMVSRIFQELSNGILAYNGAIKIKQVPVPFAYVQFNALILNSFNLLAPIAVARFTEDVAMSIITAVLISGGFTAMWLVANEMEDPFGADHNDLPVLQYHEHFCGAIRNLLRWLDIDTWSKVDEDDAWLPPNDDASAAAAHTSTPMLANMNATPFQPTPFASSWSKTSSASSRSSPAAAPHRTGESPDALDRLEAHSEGVHEPDGDAEPNGKPQGGAENVDEGNKPWFSL